MPILALGTLAANFSNPIHGNTDRQSFVVVKNIASAAARMRHNRCRLVSWGYTLLGEKSELFRHLSYLFEFKKLHRICRQHPISLLQSNSPDKIPTLLLIVARNIKSYKKYQVSEITLSCPFSSICALFDG